jgi:hypothetical protein
MTNEGHSHRRAPSLPRKSDIYLDKASLLNGIKFLGTFIHIQIEDCLSLSLSISLSLSLSLSLSPPLSLFLILYLSLSPSLSLSLSFSLSLSIFTEEHGNMEVRGEEEKGLGQGP